jgi:glycosyltransferase involved in cell wall biosynthesis
MARDVAPLRDLRALAGLVRVMRTWQPHIVNAGTPKAGLLAMVAARLARVPVRIYLLRGLRLEGARGAARLVLTATERIASACADEVIAVSRSLAERYEELGLTPADKLRVLGEGASNGVVLSRFMSRPAGETLRLRADLGLAAGTPVLGFVGRFTRDKGIADVLRVLDLVRQRIPEARLLLLGDFEAGDAVAAAEERRIRTDPALVWPGFVPDAAPYYSLMDVLVFPSRREGFPNAPLEAAAAGVPVVGFHVTGTIDAVADGATGTLVTYGDVDGLAAAAMRYLDDSALRRAHGAAGHARVVRHYQAEQVWQAMLAEYQRLLALAGVPAGVPAYTTSHLRSGSASG